MRYPVSAEQLAEFEAFVSALRAQLQHAQGSVLPPEDVLAQLEKLTTFDRNLSQTLEFAANLTPRSPITALIELSPYTRRLFRGFISRSRRQLHWVETLEDLGYFVIDELRLGERSEVVLHAVMDQVGITFPAEPLDDFDWIRTIHGLVPPTRYPALNPGAHRHPDCQLFVEAGLDTIAAFIDATDGALEQLVYGTVQGPSGILYIGDYPTSLKAVVSEVQRLHHDGRSSNDGFARARDIMDYLRTQEGWLKYAR